jgi:hypothetical protein
MTNTSKEYGANILQLEYALVMNTDRKDTIRRLEYDVSLLDCARPPPEHAQMSDAMASTDLTWNKKKIDGCPGYQNGLAVWFGNSSICRPIYCDGINYCDGVYNYDRTRAGEVSFECLAEYRGDLNFEACAANGNGYVYLQIEVSCLFVPWLTLRLVGVRTKYTKTGWTNPTFRF